MFSCVKGHKPKGLGAIYCPSDQKNRYHIGLTLARITAATETQTESCTAQVLKLTHADISASHIAQSLKLHSNCI